MMSTTAIPSGFRALSPDETEVVTGGFRGGTIFFTLSGGKLSWTGGGFGDTSATGNPFKSLDSLYTPEGQAAMAALFEWIEAGAPWPPVIDLGPGIEPSPTAPPIMSGPAPATGGSAPVGSGSGGAWDANAHLH